MKPSLYIRLALIASLCALALAFATACTSGASSSGPSSASGDSASAEAPASASASSAASVDPKQAEIEKAIADGYQVFEGTVRVVSPEELIELQEIDIDPAVASNGGTYAVLVFDEPADVNGMSADGSGERTESAAMLGIAEHTEYGSFVVEYGDLDACKALDGQHVTIAVLAQDITFPSDVRLPIGEPWAETIAVIG